MDKCGCNLATCRMCKPDNECGCDYNVRKICDISERMRRIEEHKNRQIDENRKVSQRLDELLGHMQRIEKAMDNQVEYLQNEINDKIQKAFKYTPYPESLCKRFDNIEKEISRLDICNEIQNSENTKVRKRLDDNDKRLNDQLAILAKQDQRIDKLEKEIIELKRFQDITHKQYYSTDRKPHRCPVCDGLGEFEMQSMEEIVKNGGHKFKKCRACENGIVWG